MNTRDLAGGLMAVMLAGLWALVGSAQPSYAAPDGISAWYADSQAVVVGRVTQVQPDDGRTTLRVGVEQSFKGDLDGQVALTAPAQGSQCAVEGIAQGRRMVFFIGEKQGRAVVDSCTGTQQFTKKLEKRLSSLAERAGEGPGKPKPEAASLKRVSYEEPLGFVRMAAPGAAAVILGILAMLVAVRAARR